MPGHVDEKLPAKSPYTIQKHMSGAKLVEKPQSRNIDAVEPSVERRIQVVTSYLSTIEPMMMQPNTLAMLKRMIVSAERDGVAPSWRAYVGR